MGVTFTESGAAKIKQVVNKVLNPAQDRTADRNRPHPTETFFWGMITGSDISGLRYKFIRVIPDASKDGADFIIDDGPAYRIAGEEPETGYARETNSYRPIRTGTVVLINFIGYDRDGEAAYIFQYVAPPYDPTLPLHDHRDNSPGAGGYAFSVFHPGTSIPQQNWAV